MTIQTTVIENITFNSSTNRTQRVFYEVPEVYEPQPSSRRKSRSNHIVGLRTNIPKNRYFSTLLIANEFQACLGKPADKDSLRRKMLGEYPDHKKAVYYYFNRFSEKRKEHNKGACYVNQPQPPFYSWYYNASGYLIHSKAQVVMGYEDCILELKANNFIDPRFYSQKQINIYRAKRLDGDPRCMSLHIPLQEDIDKLSKALDPKFKPGLTYISPSNEEVIPCNSPLYQSITFPEGYGPKYK